MPKKTLSRAPKACTNCRQQKIRCNAAETSPDPCTRCSKLNKKCVIDPFFQPRKGTQVDELRAELASLKQRIERDAKFGHTETKSKLEPQDSPQTPQHGPVREPLHEPLDDSLPQIFQGNALEEDHSPSPQPSLPPAPTPGPYTIENIVIKESEAAMLHATFVEGYLPACPIFETNSCGELFTQSEMLFWTVLLTASISNSTPDLYLRLVEPVRRLVARNCLLETPRSTHVVQALVILANWGLPNEKVNEDPSYRYLSLARTIAMQLGLHRGKFIYEFTRKQKLMPNAVKWRTRTWISIYITEQLLTAMLGVPSNMRVDFLLEEATKDIPLDERGSILKLAMWYSNMAQQMGSSTRTPDGLLHNRVRIPSIQVFDHDLSSLAQLMSSEPTVQIFYEYCRLMLYTFAFLPGSTESDQANYICPTFECATRLITLMRNHVGKRRIVEFSCLVRQASMFAAFMLFKLHVLPQFPQQFFESARHSVVTVHHLFRNIPHGWTAVSSDVTRAAKILESLNITLISHPYLLTGPSLMITHMRSHLSYSLFYELVWTIHEARRRTAQATKQNEDLSEIPQQLRGPEVPENVRVVPALPLFNQITTEDYTASTYTSPNGTTMTMLVPAGGSNGANVPNGPTAGGTTAPETVDTLDSLLQGIDWMGHEGDDILGWVPNEEFTI